MASNYTEHLNLCQWAAEDAVLREDFNADNQKLEAAIAEKATILLGSYTGDGTKNREIVLGFRPKYVHVWNNNNQNSDTHIAYSGIATEYGHTSVNNHPAVQLTDQGFMVDCGNYSDSYAGYYIYTNIAENGYTYLVIK